MYTIGHYVHHWTVVYYWIYSWVLFYLSYVYGIPYSLKVPYVILDTKIYTKIKKLFKRLRANKLELHTIRNRIQSDKTTS